MSTNPEATSTSVWEKMGDFFSACSEKIGGFMTRLFGSSNERYVRKLGYIRPPRGQAVHTVIPGSLLAQINEHEDKMKALSDDELRGLTPKFRERLKKGATLDDLLPEAFAACREAARRNKNMRHYDVQMLGGIVLHRGNIAEMVTGEGKTLVATLPAYLNALESKGVHIITVNDYLARRDCEWMTPIYKALGVTAGFIQSDMDPADRRKAYDCDITYGTNSEYGFDYLRDNMKPARWGDPNFDPYYHQCQKSLHYAIIDEVDNILIDEARTPLIISGQAFSDVRRYTKANEIAVSLTDLEKRGRRERRGPAESAVAETADGSLRPLKTANPDEPTGIYFEIKEKEHTCHLTDEGVRKAEELAGVESFYTAGNMEWPHLIDNALKAHHLYKKDKQYAVMRNPENNEMAIIIIDEFTGRLMHGRQWSDGLHQAVEAKHARDGVKIKEETQTLATITLQNFFKLYKKVAGMTGTAMTEANEFWKIYHLEVIAIPTNKPLIRVNHTDVIFRTEKEKWNAVVEEIERVNKWDVLYLKDGSEVEGTIRTENETGYDLQLAGTNQRQQVAKDQVKRIERKGRPMLVGTTDVDKSLKLSELLKRRGIKHELLNALPEHAAREAEIVAQAGRIGAVTISTNMAGRGTDIILGGNPETLAWAKLKDKYPTLLDVPEEEWKRVVSEIETREKMKEEGRRVADMGGLHIIGTERHESRRIDNQLRGRAGRQGDPGSSRFYLSLQDDLMRIFAGEWVSSLLERLGMTEGQSIESRMVSRRVESAQKKVEERHFDSRKHLLDYDEVMDKQRKEIYSYRQRILDDNNPKMLIVTMLDREIEKAVGRFLDKDYGAASFAEFASKRLGIEFKADDFHRCDFTEADRLAKEKAARAIETHVVEMLEENLGDEDPKEWNWQALSGQVNKMWNLKTTDRQLKQIGKDELSTYLTAEANKAVDAVDLSDGKEFLGSDWGPRSLCDWARLKFQIKVTLTDLSDKTEDAVRRLLRDKVLGLYRQRDVEFPVMAAMARFMSDKTSAGVAGGQRYNREGLYHWARDRFPQASAKIVEDDFRTGPRHRLQETLLEVARAVYPAKDQIAIDEKLDDAFHGTNHSEPADAKELSEWAKQELGLEVPEATLTGVTKAAARETLWNAFDRKYRPEMRGMERGLLLNLLDSSWKNHLYDMDYLRSGVGLRSYGQEDPKIVYKQEGMKKFREMWDNIEDKITDVVFRMEETEAFQESLWVIGRTIHEAAPRERPTEQTSANGAGDKKPEPIRNRGEKVGRNDPCPCGSGKKYKNCHMRQKV
jgi:preprotein translocase subunit SecA